MIAIEDIKEKLQDCIDPELQVSITDLGLLYDMKEENGLVTLLMTLTTPGCPLMSILLEDIKQKVKTIPNVKNVEINLTFDPPWTPERMSDEARLKLGF